MIKFEWDENKNIINIEKHGVSFKEASTVFDDEYGVLISDVDHSDKEERFLLIGVSSIANILIVCHCYRDNDETIRIISARKANKEECVTYYERNGL